MRNDNESISITFLTKSGHTPYCSPFVIIGKKKDREKKEREKRIRGKERSHPEDQRF